VIAAVGPAANVSYRSAEGAFPSENTVPSPVLAPLDVAPYSTPVESWTRLLGGRSIASCLVKPIQAVSAHALLAVDGGVNCRLC
jgi:hypothetical protein